MPRNIKRHLFPLLIIPFIVACQPQSDAELQQEVASLKQDIKQLRQDLTTIGAQVKEIHTIATNAQKPRHKTLPTQTNFDANGELPLLGETTAQLAIIEFSDYQCPFCKRFLDQTFEKLKANYIDVGKVKYLTRDFPLSFHPKAKGAAVAANCSLQQDAYWAMRTALFKNMRQLSDELYQQLATDLSLDMTAFTDCLSDPEALSKIEQDIALGSSLGIKGTPSFLVGRIENNQLINPRLVVGAQSYETFVLLLDELLQAEPSEK